MQSRTLNRTLALALATAAVCSSEAGAIAYAWTLGTGLAGLWSTTTNWTPVSAAGGPTTGDSVVYGAAGTFTTTFSANAGTDIVAISNGTVTLRSSSAVQRTLNLTTGLADLSVSGATSTLNVGSAANPLIINVGDDLNIATNSGNDNDVIVDGSLSQLNLTNTLGSSVLNLGANGGNATLTYRNSASGVVNGDIQLGSSASAATRAFINLESGATLTTTSLTMADVAGSAAEGTINLSGAGTVMTVSSSSLIGNASGTGAARINIGAGATLALQTSGHTLQSSGSILMTGGTLNLNGAALDVAGGVIDSTAGGLVQFGSANATVFSGGAVKLGASGTTISGFINVSDTGSAFNSAGSITLSGALGYTANASGSLANVNLQSAGLLQIDAGSIVTANNIFAGTSSTAGNISVGGTLTLNGTSGFAINSGSAVGTNGIDILAGGVMSTGTGTSTVANGDLSINGTLNANGQLIVNSGGSVELLSGTAALNANNNLTLNSGSTFTASTTSSFVLAPTRTFTVASGGVVTLSGSRIHTGGTFNISSNVASTLGLTSTTFLGSVVNVTTSGGGSLSSTSFNCASGATILVSNTGSLLSCTGGITLNGNTTSATADNGTISVGGAVTLLGGAHLRELNNGQVTIGGPIYADGGSTLSLLNGGFVVPDTWFIANSVVNVGGMFEVGQPDQFYNYNSQITVGGFNIIDTTNVNFDADTILTVTVLSSSFGGNGSAPTRVRFNDSDLVFTTSGAQLLIGSSAPAFAQPVDVELTNESVFNVPVTFMHSSLQPVNLNVSQGSIFSGDQVAAYGAQSTISVSSQGILDVDNIVLQEGARLHLNSGTVRAQAFVLADGLSGFDWTSGTVNLTLNTTHALGAVQAIGSNVSLTPGKTLDVDGTLSLPLNTSLHLSGGILEVNTLSMDGGTLLLDSGTLRSPNSFTVAAGAALGSELLLKPGLSITASQLSNNGLVHGNGTVNARLLNDAGGELRVDLTDTARFVTTNPIGHTNLGRIVLNGGRLDLNAPLNNGPQGDITGRGTLVSTLLDNAGDLALSSGISDIYGDVANHSGARILISGNADVTFWNDVINNAGATLRVSTGSSATFFGTYSGGSITGGGSVYFEADVTPGFSPALISLGGDVRFSEASRLVIELGGATRGSQYDALDIAGDLDLFGGLDIALINSYTPGDLVAHRVLSAASVAGTFSFTHGIILSPTRRLAVTYVGNDVYITSTLPGDADVNGTINFNDLLALARNYNQSGSETWQNGDFDGDRAVTFNDLLALAKNYGQSLLLGEGLSLNFESDWALAQSMVPEPATMGLLAGLIVLRRRRREV